MTEANLKILVAIDDSDESFKAVEYVGSVMGGRPGVEIQLLHVLPPLPPDLLEFGGSEDPGEEEAREAEIHAEQEAWVAEARRKAEPLYAMAARLLTRSGIDPSMIRVRHCVCVNRQETVQGIIDCAKDGGCGTIVVGRTAFRGLHKLAGRHISDQLIRQCRDLTIWVVK